jgi:hypothetical protein
MKKALFIFIFITVFTVNLFSQNVYEDLQASLANMTDFVIQTVGNVNYYEYISDNNPLFGGRVSANNSITINFTLNSNNIYVFHAGIDYANSVPLRIYQGNGTNGELIANGSFQNRKANIARFKPKVSGVHTVELVNPSNQPAVITMLALQVSRYATFNLHSFKSARDYLTSLFRHRSNSSLNFIIDDFFFFGNVVYEFLAAGDRSVNNINALVFESDTTDFNRRSRNISTTPGWNSRVDFAAFTAVPSNFYMYRIENRRSSDNSGFLIGLLVIR